MITMNELRTAKSTWRTLGSHEVYLVQSRNDRDHMVYKYNKMDDILSLD